MKEMRRERKEIKVKQIGVLVLAGLLMLDTSISSQAAPASCEAMPQPARMAATQMQSTQKAKKTKVKKAKVKKGLVLEKRGRCYYRKGKRIRSTWKTIKKRKYYFDKKGFAVTGVYTIKGVKYLFNEKGRLVTASKGGIRTVGKRKYYVNNEGQLSTGWKEIKGKLYFFRNNNANMVFGKSVDGIAFSKSGAAENSTRANLKLLCMQILPAITSPEMIQERKLRVCFDYVASRNFFYVTWRPFAAYPDWEVDYAYEFLKLKGGNCYNFAAAFAMLAKEAGYEAYVIRGRVPGGRDGAGDGYTRHSWVQINGLFYDPEAQYDGWAREIYGSPYYPMGYQINEIHKV